MYTAYAITYTRYKLQKGSRNRIFEIASYLIIPYSYFALFAQYSAYTPLTYTYSSDFWGCMKLPKKDNPVEIMQMKVFKQILGVHKQTTNIGVLLELGRGTLDIECIKFGIKNWERIRGGNANKLIIDSYNNALMEGLAIGSKNKGASTC